MLTSCRDLGGNERDKRHSTCLFVGNLPYHFRERDLEDYFGRCGRIRNVTVGINRRSNQSKGYAFVEFEDRRDAEDAFEKYVYHQLFCVVITIVWSSISIFHNNKRLMPFYAPLFSSILLYAPLYAPLYVPLCPSMSRPSMSLYVPLCLSLLYARCYLPSTSFLHVLYLGTMDILWKGEG